MAIILDGTKLSTKINEESKAMISNFDTKPRLVAIQVGDNPESTLYIEHKNKKSLEVGISFTHIKFEGDITEEHLINEIEKLNNDDSVDGVMVQLPLPPHIETTKISQVISPTKDVDGFNPLNKGLLDIDKAELMPPTALGVIKLFEEYNIDIKGLEAVMIGVGEISGKPLAKMFLNKGATVTMCNKDTKDIIKFSKDADILVVAVGHKHLIDNDGIKEGAIIVNIGVTKDNDGIHGDVTYDNMLNIASYITPITGGTGPMTVSLLIRNTILCFKNKNEIK